MVWSWFGAVGKLNVSRHVAESASSMSSARVWSLEASLQGARAGGSPHVLGAGAPPERQAGDARGDALPQEDIGS